MGVRNENEPVRRVKEGQVNKSIGHLFVNTSEPSFLFFAFLFFSVFFFLKKKESFICEKMVHSNNLQAY